MVALFQNPNVATALVERLPCAFAPSVNGKLGTHYAMVLLDRKGNVIYVGSECEHLNGEGVQVLHEMGDKDSTLCYVVTAAFRKALAVLHTHRGASIHEKEDLPKDASILTGHMYHLLQKVWIESVDKHNNRFAKNQLPPWTREDYQRKALQSTVNQVTASLLALRPSTLRPSMLQPGSLHSYNPVSNVAYPNVFDIRRGPDGYLMYFPRYSGSFACRENGKWLIQEDRIKSWAKDYHTTFENAGKNRSYFSEKRCLFCNEVFDRMSKHTQGARHIDRVLEVAKMTCKATERMGLQMINNPRTRSVFIKR